MGTPTYFQITLPGSGTVTPLYQSQPDFGSSFKVRGGFLDAPISSLKWVPKRIFSTSKFFHIDASKNFEFGFLNKKGTKILKTRSGHEESTEVNF
jgi:hypothetical protein